MAENKRSSNKKNNFKLDSPGPYLAKVINNIDPERMGALEVELLRSVGNAPSATQQLFTVRYCSPFYGITDVAHNTPNTNYDYNETQKSYGFWMVPPDTGTIVMVMFVDGWAGEGYWFGCVPDKNMNHMIPGLAGSKSIGNTTRDQTQEAWIGNTAQAGRGGGNRVAPGGGEITIDSYFDGANTLPAAEYNKMQFRENNATFNPDPDANIKPVHPIAFNINRQGLIKDPTRGVHTSSARRETPSNVFGISSPGPIDKREGAQKGQVGRKENPVTKFVSRLGGTTIVMDDGNDKRLRKHRPWEGPNEYADLEKNEEGGLVDLPEDEGFRIRTRTGHQILMSNTEDLIYINNSRGTAWIELTSNGKIDIYAQDSVSIHSEVDFNFTADRDINLTAGGNININSTGNMRTTAGGSHEETIGEHKTSQVGHHITEKAGTYRSSEAGQSQTMVALNGGINQQANNGSFVVNSTGDISLLGLEGFRADTLGAMHMRSEAAMYMAGSQIEQSAMNGGMQLNAKQGVSFKTEGSFYHEFTGDFFIKAKSVAFDADEINLNSGVATAALGELNGYNTGFEPNPGPRARTAQSQTAGNTEMMQDDASARPSTSSPLAVRVPEQEPWLQHENLNPQFYTPDRTRAGQQQIDSYGPFVGSAVLTSADESYPGEGGYGDEEGGDPGSAGESKEEEYNSGNTGLTPNAKTAIDYLKKTGGMTLAQACGFVGNFQWEAPPTAKGRSAPDPKAFNNDGDGFGARGIAQWRGTRVKQFQVEYGKDVLDGSLEEQLEFVLKELGIVTPKDSKTIDPIAKNGWEKTQKPATEESASMASTQAGWVDDYFERSKDTGNRRAGRKTNAAACFEEYQGGRDPSSNIAGAGEKGAPEYASPGGTRSIGGFPPSRQPGDSESTQQYYKGQDVEPDPSGSQSSSPIDSSFPPATDAGLDMRVSNKPSGKTRNRPCKPGIVNALNYAAHAAGVEKVIIYSGRQPGYGGGRTGSRRHDTGDAADFYLLIGGRRVKANTAEGRQIWAKFTAAAVSRGVLGIGGPSSSYMAYSNPNTNAHFDLCGSPSLDYRTLTFWHCPGFIQGAAREGLKIKRDGPKR